MHLKSVAFAVLACLGALTARVSYADTLTLKSVSGTVVDDVYVYPYNLSLNQSAATTPMMCINYNDHVSVGESWAVTPLVLSSKTLSTFTTSMAAAYEEDAYLFSLVGTNGYTDSEIQFAAWDILDATDVSGLSGFDKTAQGLVKQAKTAQPTLSDSFLSRYTLYVPVNTAAASATWGSNGLPQTFIAADPVAVTPEPSSLLLLGTGLSAASLLLLRKRALEEQGGLA